MKTNSSAAVQTRLGRALQRCARAIDFIGNDSGRANGISRWQKYKLLRRILRNYRQVRAESTRHQHLQLVDEILRLPKSLQGDVVECGCFNGASSVSLSLACAMTGRRLFVCDSFQGLPEPTEQERNAFLDDGQGYAWAKGQWASEGRLQSVRATIEKFGAPEVCHFVEGYFSDTLEHLETDSIVLVFEDADLLSSVQDCLKHLWPKLRAGCKFFCHEPWSFDIVSLFFDTGWWERELGVPAPGFKGSVIGMPAARGIGYATKLDARRDRRIEGKGAEAGPEFVSSWEQDPPMHYPVRQHIPS